MYPPNLIRDFANPVEVLAVFKQLTELDAGVDVLVNDKPIKMIVFALAYIGDMPQQQWNAGFLGARAKLSCRGCYISEEDGRGNLDYDIVSDGRYHYQVMALREEIHQRPQGRQQERFANRLGMLVGKTTSFRVGKYVILITMMTMQTLLRFSDSLRPSTSYGVFQVILHIPSTKA